MEPMDVTNISPLKVFENLERHKDEFRSECKKFAQKLTNDECTILQIMEDLGPFLVNDTPHRRSEGMWVVSAIIEFVPKHCLDSTQLQLVSVFYADRLKDHSQVIPPALTGILSLIQHEKLPDGACTRLLSSLFQNVACQQQPVPERQIIYQIFEIMINRKPNELHAMSYDFIYGVISAMDSERDPSNLIYLFHWLPTFLKEFQFGHLIEEMFEVIACYFPVDFKVPAHMAKGISRESLATTLAPCLCAIPEFAEFCLPLALEKLNSNLRIAKLDSLELLCMGCENFLESKYLEHATNIWTSIQLELFKINNEDIELEEICLKTLQRFINKISVSNTDTFKTILRNITDSLRGNIMLEQTYFKPSVKLLLNVSRGSKNSAKHVSQQILPLLLNLFQITADMEKKVLILGTLCNFTEIYLEMNDGNEVPEINFVINLCLEMAVHNEVNLRAKALECSSKFVKNMDSNALKIFGEILHNYLYKDQESQVITAVKLCLHEFSKSFANELLNVITYKTNLSNLKSTELYINYLVSVVDQPSLQAYVLNFVLEHCFKYSEITPISFTALKSIFEKHECNEDIQSYVFNKGIISHVSNSLLSNSKNEIFSDELLRDISYVFKILIGFQSSFKQQEIIASSENVFNSFKTRPTVINLYIIDGLITRLRQEVVIDFYIIDPIFNIALAAVDENILDTSAQLLANVVNKIPNDDNLFDNLYNKCRITFEEGNIDHNYIKNICCITTWITKSLLMRGHHLSHNWIIRLMDLVKNYEATSQYLKVIMRDNYSSLSEVSYCTKRLFYQQRFFSEFATIMNHPCNQNEDNYLLAFALILEDIPEILLKMYFDKVIHLIISILNKSEEPRALQPVLLKLKYLIDNQDESASFYMEKFVSRLLKLAQFKNSMAIRILAIECLDLYTNGYPVYKLLHFKENVIQVLRKLLDDHKRLVRKAAMEARLKWYLLDAPT